jgi:uncharacterized protein (TIGR00251 family)
MAHYVVRISLPLFALRTVACFLLKRLIAMRATRVPIYVQPRAAKTEIAGLYDGCVKVRLAAPPADGAANKALIEFIAQRLGVAKSRVRLISGESSRRKLIEIDGVSQEAVAAALQ